MTAWRAQGRGESTRQICLLHNDCSSFSSLMMHRHSKDTAYWLQYMPLYRLRKWITLSINDIKIRWNLFEAFYLEQNAVRSGIYRVIDILSLHCVFLLCLPASLTLTTFSHIVAHREWVTWNKLSHRQLCFQPERGSVQCLDPKQV